MTNEKECYVCEQTVGQSSRRVMLFAEAEGFAHLHFHIVPRQPDLPADRRGPAILGHLERNQCRRSSETALPFVSEKPGPPRSQFATFAVTNGSGGRTSWRHPPQGGFHDPAQLKAGGPAKAT